MVRILFLDVDGVLNSKDHDKQVGRPDPHPRLGLWEDATQQKLLWCPMMVARVRRIVARTGCDIVISSDWRGYPASHARWKWQQMFGCYGWPDAPVVGETPDLQTAEMKLRRERAFRGDEVDKWLKSNDPVQAFVCLDDKPTFHRWQPLVRTDEQFGLQDEHVERSIEILNRGIDV